MPNSNPDYYQIKYEKTQDELWRMNEGVGKLMDGFIADLARADQRTMDVEAKLAKYRKIAESLIRDEDWADYIDALESAGLLTKEEIANGTNRFHT